MTRSELLDLVYRFHPRGLDPDGLGYDDTEERFRQLEAARRGVADYPRWKAMMRRLSERYGIWDWSLQLLGGSCVPAYSGWIHIPEYRIGFHVSLLGPCYVIHRLGVPGEEDAALDIAREIEATYAAYEPIPPELGEEVVPDVALDKRYFGKATIYDCLLSQDWKSSEPDDGKPRYIEPRTEDEEPVPDTDVESEPNIHYKDVRS
jgi:hypothetical protein